MSTIKEAVKLTNAGKCISGLKQERDNYRDLCAELLSALKNLNGNEGDFNEDIHSYFDWKNSREKADLVIKKAEKTLRGWDDEQARA